MSSLSQAVKEIESLAKDLEAAKTALKCIETPASVESIQLSFERCHLDLGYRNTMLIGDATKRAIEQAIRADFSSYLKRAIEAMEADLKERNEKMLIQAAQFVAGR
ncbi:hypothetical protein PsAD2_02962 [Pseudovibrio axinellae]|uniref:Uncharacterized protein n=1 Tax=Pseudovibrio axinellae TaxID=989403 RepID=A0A165XEB7_9HYPH|nr:hypothetical protein [Pseudovibrio axinellae]KZL17626.1 hypothetical protein PsAD2_02962 [Pseudovibrio axinellae]SER45812.1 hypothetical protein SAMN05421798_110120 [Pseudovibrio axinellae]